MAYLPDAPLLYGPNDMRGSLAAALREIATTTYEKYGVGVRNPYTYGALGDGVNDDTAAIQAALDDYVNNTSDRGPTSIVFFPPGKFHTTAPINLNGRSFVIYGSGLATKIVASFNDFVFARTDTAVVTNCVMRDFAISNSGALGGGLRLNGSTNLRLDNLFIQAHAGILREYNNFTSCYSNLTIRRGGNYAGSYGLKAYWHLALINIDMQNFEVAYQIGAPNVNVVGGRTEVCGTGFLIGLDPFGGANGMEGSIIGHYFEACDTAFDIRPSGQLRIADNKIYASVNSPSGDPSYGIKIHGLSNSVIEYNSIGARFSKSAIGVLGKVSGLTIRDNAIGNGHPSGINRQLDAVYTSGLVLIGMDKSTTPEVLARCVRQRVRKAADVVVSAAATYLDVVFPAAYGSAYSAAVVSAVAGAGGSLAAGTYFYLGLYVNEAGEGLPAADGGVYYVRSADVLDGGTVTLTFGGTTPPSGVWHRRVFRGHGTWPGGAGADLTLFDGYFDLPVGSHEPFVDTGAAFDGVASPRVGDRGELGWLEADALYKVDVRPSWGTTWWVSDRATTGFRINFGTAPQADSTLDWSLVR